MMADTETTLSSSEYSILVQYLIHTYMMNLTIMIRVHIEKEFIKFTMIFPLYTIKSVV